MSVLLQKYITGPGSVEISRGIEKAVRDGLLEPGARLPTVRALAEWLGASPTTVNAAYRELRRRGVITTKGRNGTAVSLAPPITTRPTAVMPPGIRNLALGNPDPDLLPSLRRAIAGLSSAQRLYDADAKSATLLDVAARRLRRDGVEAGTIAMTSGALDAIERVLQAHLRPGDRVIVEDPAFVGILDLLGTLGLEIVPAAIDDFGIVPQALERALEAGAQALIVVPRAQNPTGAAIDEKRAKALRRVLRGWSDLLVIEDDHAADVAGVPLHTLTRDTTTRWLYTRSVSKSLGPDLRLAVVTGDAETLARLEGRQLLGMRWVSHLLQEIVASLWTDKRMDATLDSAERTYSQRRNALLDALAGHGIAAQGRSGLNVWVRVDDEAAIVQALRDSGWAVAPGHRFRIESAPGVRVTTAGLIPADAKRFADAFARVIPPRGRVAAGVV
jgi:DNA-binding transcriptional MocR family regulator